MGENAITKREMRALLKSQQGELDAVLMYNALAAAVKERRDAETFRRLAAEEGRHAAVFRAVTGRTLEPKRTKARLLPLLYRLLGRRRLYPLIARGEYAAVKNYRAMAGRYPGVSGVRDDEQRHGDAVMALL